jgi:hypothetical protein
MLFGKKHIWLGECIGMEIQIQSDTSLHYRYCEISAHKELLTINKKNQAEGELQKVFKNMPAKPLAISITGKGVLIKKTARQEYISPQILDQLFPNLTADQFYIQNFKSGEHSFVSIIRKEVVDRIIDEIDQSGLKILLVTIGPFAASQCISQLNFYNNTAQFDGHRIVYTSEYDWESYQYLPGLSSEFPLKIDIEPIDEAFVLAYATAFQLLLLNKLKLVNINVPLVDFNLKEYSAGIKFKRRLAVFTGFLFSALLINFCVFSYFNNQNQVLGRAVNASSAQVGNMRDLEKQITDKESLIKSLGWNRGISYAFIIDRIAQSVPKTITLDDLSINPLKEKGNQFSNATANKEYETGKIKIIGHTDNVTDFNNWVSTLKEMSWIKKTAIAGYSPDQNIETANQFTVLISY